MPSQLLKNRVAIRLTGEEAITFLQNLVTANIEDLGSDKATPCALLTPQGKIAFDFLITKTAENEFLIDIRRDVAPDFMKRIQLYKLRAKVEVEQDEDLNISAYWGEEDRPNDAASDTRFPSEASVYRSYSTTAAAEEGEFDLIRIEHGVAESGSDFELNDIFPHDIYYDLNEAIDFRKGCYVGQEVVSRMQHRGSARKRVVIINAAEEISGSDTAIHAEGKVIGELGTIQGNQALAILRVDRLISAQEAGKDIMVCGQAVHISFPNWVGDRYIPKKVESVL